MILFGEHAVGYGQPAIATPIDRGLTLTAILRGDGPATRFGGPALKGPSPQSGEEPEAVRRLEEAIGTAAGYFSLAPCRIAIGIESDIPAGCGLGSSAALSVTLLRALADLARSGPDRAEGGAYPGGIEPYGRDPGRAEQGGAEPGGAEPGGAEFLERAGEVECAFHGVSSGLDVAAVGLGATVWFQRTARPHATPLPVGRSFELVVATTSHWRSTADQVRQVRQGAGSRPDVFHRRFARLGDLARSGRDALRTGDLATLGRLMDEAQHLLDGMGLSTPALDHAITTARAAGALGAKLTGAGGGGAVIALAPGNAAAVASAVRSAGHRAFVSRVHATPPPGPAFP
ncbi:mevalonate kinase [Streptomyces sp. NPDC048718]|uniref:mevalonate kinase n=1 Tax=Streptomyces sp. NPDC048718 TaxID=3365587 RepID=UPI00371876C5